MMGVAIVCGVLAGLLVIALVVLVIIAARDRLSKARERRAMRLRDEQMRRWGFASYERSARERRL